MKFCDFVKMLYPILHEDNNESDFVMILFENIVKVDAEEAQAFLDNCSPSSFGGYFRGDNDISRLAKNISSSIDALLFAKYIDRFDVPQKRSLVAKFKYVFKETDENSISNDLGFLFEEIILTAAEPKPRRGQKKVIPDEGLSADDSELLYAFQSDSRDLLTYIIINDPSGSPTKLSLADEIQALIGAWEIRLFEIRCTPLRSAIGKTLMLVEEYLQYLSPQYLATCPGRNDFLWIKNRTDEEGVALREVFQPNTDRLRQEIALAFREICTAFS